MGPLLQQLPALVGVLVGALATYLTTAAAERARWRRAQTTRWDASRQVAYAEYGAAVKHLAWLATRVAVSRGFEHSVEALDAEAGLPLIAAAEGERSVKWENVLLLGDADAVAAARSWHQAAIQITWYARGMLTDESAWPDALRHMEAERDRFYAAARKDLGVNRGTLSGQPLWPPAWLSSGRTSPPPSSGE